MGSCCKTEAAIEEEAFTTALYAESGWHSRSGKEGGGMDLEALQHPADVKCDDGRFDLKFPGLVIRRHAGRLHLTHQLHTIHRQSFMRRTTPNSQIHLGHRGAVPARAAVRAKLGGEVRTSHSHTAILLV